MWSTGFCRQPLSLSCAKLATRGMAFAQASALETETVAVGALALARAFQVQRLLLLDVEQDLHPGVVGALGQVEQLWLLVDPGQALFPGRVFAVMGCC